MYFLVPFGELTKERPTKQKTSPFSERSYTWGCIFHGITTFEIHKTMQLPMAQTSNYRSSIYHVWFINIYLFVLRIEKEAVLSLCNDNNCSLFLRIYFIFFLASFIFDLVLTFHNAFCLNTKKRSKRYIAPVILSLQKFRVELISAFNLILICVLWRSYVKARELCLTCSSKIDLFPFLRTHPRKCFTSDLNQWFQGCSMWPIGRISYVWLFSHYVHATGSRWVISKCLLG